MIVVCDIYTQRLPTNFNLTTFSSHLNCKISNNLLLMYVYLLLISIHTYLRLIREAIVPLAPPRLFH